MHSVYDYLIWGDNDVCCDEKCIVFSWRNDVVGDIPNSSVKMSPLFWNRMELLVGKVCVGNAFELGSDGRFNFVKLLVAAFVYNHIADDVCQNQSLDESRDHTNLENISS